MTRLFGTPPIVDVDGSLWSVFVTDQGPDATIAIQVCDGFTVDKDGRPHSHPFDGDWHEGDLHLFLDNANADRLFFQLREAFDSRNAHSAKS